jgi:hypothetical protein
MNQLDLAGGVVKDGDASHMNDVGIFINDSPKPNSTGSKRNELIAEAIKCWYEYVAFIDDDDMVGETYLQRGMEVVASGMDCGELVGQIYFSGKKGMPFHHYIDCTHAWEDDKQYHRPANHLNFWKLDLVKDFKFQDKVFGEDMTWAMEIKQAGVFKTMYPIPEIIYHYYSGEPKHEIA